MDRIGRVLLGALGSAALSTLSFALAFVGAWLLYGPVADVRHIARVLVIVAGSLGALWLLLGLMREGPDHA